MGQIDRNTNGDDQSVDALFDGIRARLLNFYGIEGSDVVLTGSGTDAELIGLAITKSVLRGRLTNIVIAPAETGRGVLRAARGAHFVDSTPFEKWRPLIEQAFAHRCVAPFVSAEYERRI